MRAATVAKPIFHFTRLLGTPSGEPLHCHCGWVADSELSDVAQVRAVHNHVRQLTCPHCPHEQRIHHYSLSEQQGWYCAAKECECDKCPLPTP